MLHLPGFSPSEVSSLVNTDVIREHAEDAASLWLMHEHAVGAPLYRLQDLVTLDARLLAHLEALRTAGVPAKRVAQRELANDDRSSGFVAAYLAFSTSDTEAMRHVVQLAVAETRFLDPVVAALAWSNQKETEHPLRLLSRSGNPDHRRLAIAVLAAHRVNADEQYECAASDPNPSLRARTLRAIGETKTVNLTSLLTAGMRDAEPRCRFWAAWSLALMGDERAAAAAYETGIEDPALSRFALEIAMRAGDPAWTRSVIRSFVQTDTTRRRAIVAAGMFGDPAVVPWLLPMLEQPLFARAAAEAFAAITGVDLEEARFKQDGPDEAFPGDRGVLRTLFRTPRMAAHARALRRAARRGYRRDPLK